MCRASHDIILTLFTRHVKGEGPAVEYGIGNHVVLSYTPEGPPAAIYKEKAQAKTLFPHGTPVRCKPGVRALGFLSGL
jgi:hypothetical protein